MKSSDFSHQFQLTAFHFQSSVESFQTLPDSYFSVKNLIQSTKDQPPIHKLQYILHLDLRPLNLTHTHTSFSDFPHLFYHLFIFCFFFTFSKYTYRDRSTPEQTFSASLCVCVRLCSVCLCLFTFSFDYGFVAAQYETI